VAVTSTTVALAGFEALALNETLVVLLVTMTDEGMLTSVLLLLRETAVPTKGAGPVRVTFPVELPPPTIEVGEKEIDATVGGLMVSVAVKEPFRVAFRVTLVGATTPTVLAVNVAVACPAATVILEGTRTRSFELASETDNPPAGALLPSVTVPIALWPPITTVGLRVKVTTCGKVAPYASAGAMTSG